MYLHQWKDDDIRDILRFLDEILVLNQSLELEYNKRVHKLEEELKVSFITTSEKNWLNKGMVDGEKVILTKLLNKKFGSVPEQYLNKLNDANTDQLVTWSERCLDAKTLNDVFHQHP